MRRALKPLQDQLQRAQKKLTAILTSASPDTTQTPDIDSSIQALEGVCSKDRAHLKNLQATLDALAQELGEPTEGSEVKKRKLKEKIQQSLKKLGDQGKEISQLKEQAARHKQEAQTQKGVRGTRKAVGCLQ